MDNSHHSRRKFIKGTIGTGLLVAGPGILPSFAIFPASKPEFAYDAKGLPTTILGKTGVRIPRMALGLGSRFCNIETTDEAHRILNYALDNGMYYWDTAWAYVNQKTGVISEERLGEVVGVRRREIFLSTKVTSRDPDEAMRQIEMSLKRLKTDNLDMLKIHTVLSEEDVAKISEKGNLLDILTRMKEQKVNRFIGFSGHANAAALKLMVDKGIFDSMLMAINHYNQSTDPQQR